MFILDRSVHVRTSATSIDTLTEGRAGKCQGSVVAPAHDGAIEALQERAALAREGVVVIVRAHTQLGIGCRALRG